MKSIKESVVKKNAKQTNPTAKEFLEALDTFRSNDEVENIKRFFRDTDSKGNKCMGVKWNIVFKLAKESTATELKEIEKLLDSPYYEARMGAVSIMDFKARDKKITEADRKALFDLYIRRHDRINNWDLVDRSAPYVVGGYLADKPRKILYKLAKSKNVWERRTAIVSTYFFIRQGDTNDTFAIAELLVDDQHDLIQKAVGSWIREAAKKTPKMLTAFLDKHAATMPGPMLRAAIEQLDQAKRAYYSAKNRGK